MDASFQEPRVVTRSANFIFFTTSSERADQLTHCLDGLGRVDRLTGDAAYITRSAIILKPSIAFIDFMAIPTTPSATGAPLEPEAVASTLQRCLPGVVMIGVGNAGDPAMTLLALRSGVSDFIDLRSDLTALRSVVGRVSARLNASSRRAATIAVCGSRVGVGASTFAAHLATLACDDEEHPRRVALLDLGLPVGDGLLYTNTPAGFDFADAVTGLARLDETLVRTALPVSPKNVSVMALPSDLGRMRTLPQADAVMLVDQIRKYFDVVVIDLGGSGSLDLTASVLGLADVRYLMTDQGIASIVSLSDLLAQLDERSVDHASLQLLVNRYDESYGMSAQQLSERFSVKLAATIPDRRIALGRAAALGQLLVGTKQDPYIRALQKLIETVLHEDDDEPKAQGKPWSNVSRLWKAKKL